MNVNPSNTLKPEFIQSLQSLSQLPGGEAIGQLADVLSSTEPSVAVRINRRKGVEIPSGAEMVAWAPQVGFRIRGPRPRFTLDPALHQGLYYVQDPSSMIHSSIVARLSRDLGPIVYIDACAAPGGKTTAAIDSLPEGSLVIANEFDRRRAEILRENIIKWGYPSAVVSRGDTARFSRLRESAHIIAADVPCSGEGMMRKDPEAAAQWTPGLVESCASLQREIVGNLWPALKPGGYLIYSTCTFNRRENEENVQWIIDTFGALPVDLGLANSGIAPAIGFDIPCARFIPGRIEGEGLFVAVLRKPGELPPAVAADLGRVSVKTPASIISLPRLWQPLIDRLGRELDITLRGVELATLKGRDMVAAHHYVMSTLFDPSSTEVPVAGTCEVDYATAIAYLRGEAVRIDAPKGIIVLTYMGRPLGTVKNIGNRANNLYPQPWQIRTAHIPPTPPAILR